MEDTWTIKVTYTQLLLLMSSVEAYSPSGVFFTQEEKEDFQPTNINFSLFPLMGLDGRVPKSEKRQRKITKAQNELLNWLSGTAKPTQPDNLAPILQ